MQWQTNLPLIAILRGITPEEALAHVGAAIDAGFKRALATILDSNITTFIAAAVLFYIGTGQAKYRQYGLLVLKWTVLAALGFFGVLILERLA